MTQADAVWVSGVVALTVVLLTQRSAGRIAADNRLWDTRADLYLELIRWLEHDVEALRAREAYRAGPLPVDMRLRLAAFGSHPLDRRIRSYLRARDRAKQDLESRQRGLRLVVSMRLVHFQARAELGTPLGIFDRAAFAVVGSPVFTLLMTSVLAPVLRHYWQELPDLQVPDDDLEDPE